MSLRIFLGARVFDGTRLLDGQAVLVEHGRIVEMVATDRILEAPAGAVVRLAGGILAPGLIDLQVNGGDGLMLGDAATVAGITRICAAHARLGATGILPTLITDRPEVTHAVIEAGIAAGRAHVPGFLGLHLEGPHLDPRRKGAHDPALIRAMTDADLALLLHAARHLPALMVTLAPVAVTLAQIAALAQAGVVVSLGHSDCTALEARAAFGAGARCATHLFNAMSPLGQREPGLVGVVLDSPGVAAGLICDGVHVVPETLRVALAAKRGGTPAGGLFTVTDAMAVAGTDLAGFSLGGRRILRRAGRLTLADGTLAGADCTLPGALAWLVGTVGVAPERALAMASSVPAAVIGAGARCGALRPGMPADMVHLDADLALSAVWCGGERL